MSNPRNHFRIRFPRDERARLHIGAAAYPVLNLSESGASIAIGAGSKGWQSSVPVRVVFHDGAACETTAAVVREEPGELIVQFEKLIPQPMIVAEQRRLLRIYPKEVLRNGSFGERKDSQ